VGRAAALGSLGFRSGPGIGVVTLSDAREVEREAFTMEDVITRELQTATPDTPVMEAFETMQERVSGGCW